MGLLHLGQAVKTDLESLIEIYFEMRSLCLLSTLLGFAVAFQFDSKEKAQGLGLNCGCQCSSPVLTFQDAEGRQQGNCLSADAGGVWCYVDNGATSTCRDLRQSSRFPNNPWSYEACTSPPAPSPACPEPICRGTNCPTQPLCRHLGNCGPTLPVQQPGLQPIHLPILGAITGAILGALGEAHHQQQQTSTTVIPPTVLPPATTSSSTTTTAAPTTATTPLTTPTTTITTSTTTATTTTTTQTPDPWMTQITINPPSNLVQGVWGPMELCPTSTYATAFELLVAPLCDRRCMLDDDVGLMGVRLHCSTL